MKKIKLAIMSDIHSNVWALNQGIKSALENKVDKFIFLGDYITDGFKDNQVLEIIKKYGSYVIAGNREHYIIDIKRNNKKYNGLINENPLYYTAKNISKINYNFISNLPDFLEIELKHKRLLLIHGNLKSQIKKQNKNILDELINMYHFNICLFGHTHKYDHFYYKDKLFLNPGAIGQPLDGSEYKYVILDIAYDSIDFELVKFDVNSNLNLIISEYKKSDYYKENLIWCDLILNSIENGKDYCIPFLRRFFRSLKNEDYKDPQIYNNIFQLEYEKFIKNYNKK